MVLRLSLLAMLFIALVLVLVTQPASAQKQNPAADVEVLKDIVTGKGGEKAMHLTMYRLKAKQDKPMPAVVWIHGGGWMQGSYNDTQSRHLALAARGYVVASIEHRFSGEAVFPAAIEDCKLAVRSCALMPRNTTSTRTTSAPSALRRGPISPSCSARLARSRNWKGRVVGPTNRAKCKPSWPMPA